MIKKVVSANNRIATPKESCINCDIDFFQTSVRYWFGANEVGPFCKSCNDTIKMHIGPLNGPQHDTLLTYMTTASGPERDATFLRTYAARVLDGTAITWEIPNTVFNTLMGIAFRILERAKHDG